MKIFLQSKRRKQSKSNLAKEKDLGIVYYNDLYCITGIDSLPLCC